MSLNHPTIRDHRQEERPASTTYHGTMMADYSKSKSISKVPGCSRFRSATAEASKRKRAKFSQVGRTKVAAVREKGACLRCRMLKIQVDVGTFAVLCMATDEESVFVRLALSSMPSHALIMSCS